MSRLIDGAALYERLAELEELARDRVLDTDTSLPYPTNLNPAYTRYSAQLDERTRLKQMIADAPTIEPERKKGERMSNREWVDFLSEQFNVSRTSAREMLHGLMKWKAEDNFKKQY